MKKFNYLPILVFLCFCSCDTSDPFAISQKQVGPLTRTSKVSDLRVLFEKDSLVDDAGSNDFKTPQGAVTIYEKGGKALLKLTPKENTSDASIKYIQVLDNRYTTTEGITLESTFQDIQENYEIRRIENLIGAVVVFVENSDVYFTIDKKNLPPDLMFDAKSKIELSQIPDDAPIKYLQIGWE